MDGWMDGWVGRYIEKDTWRKRENTTTTKIHSQIILKIK